LYTNASGLTSSRLSDYSLVKEQYHKSLRQNDLPQLFMPTKSLLNFSGEADVIVCLAVVNPCRQFLFRLGENHHKRITSLTRLPLIGTHSRFDELQTSFLQSISMLSGVAYRNQAAMVVKKIRRS
jgi:hypothetical protein